MTIAEQSEKTGPFKELEKKLKQTSQERVQGLLGALELEIDDGHVQAAPKFTMPDRGMLPELAGETVRRHLSLDGKPMLNLASFVTTTIDKVSRELSAENLTKNLADNDEYPAMLDLHGRCVSILSDLWNVPDNEQGVGTATTGSSEAVQLGGLAMKRRWQERQKKNGRPYDKPNIVMGANAQVALEKFARYFECECRMLPVHAKDHFSFNNEELVQHCDENTIGVFAILGSTYTGHYADIAGVAAALDEFEKKTGFDIPIHIDGASGAFVAPFVTPNYPWDFRLPRVKSINTSGHKFGMCPVGCGWVIWRDRKYLPSDLLFELSYLGGAETTFTLNFSRPGHPIIVQYYALIRNGYEGFKHIHSASLQNARALSFFLENTGVFEVLSDIHRPVGTYYADGPTKRYRSLGADPELYNPGLPVVTFRFTDKFQAENPAIPQEAVQYMMRHKGYIIPNYPLPPSEEKYDCLRIVVNANLNADFLDQLMVDLFNNIEKLRSVKSKVNVTDHKQLLAALQTVVAPDDESGSRKTWDNVEKQLNYSRC